MARGPDERTRSTLSYAEQYALHKWLEANAPDIVRQEWTRDKAAEEAQRTLGFRVTEANIRTVIAVMKDVKWPWDANRNALESAERTEVARRLVELTARFEALAEKVGGGGEFDRINAAFVQHADWLARIDQSVKEIAAAITSAQTAIAVLDSEYRSLSKHHADAQPVIRDLQANVNRLLDEVGLRKLDGQAMRTAMQVIAAKK